MSCQETIIEYLNLQERIKNNMISDTTKIIPNTSRSEDPRGQILSIVDDKIRIVYQKDND